MGRVFKEHRGGSVVYLCKKCRTYLTCKEELVSTRFQGATGKAYLFERAWNTKEGSAEEREMMTGKHLVRDLLCKFCNSRLGWMYEMAYVADQQYKEGKVILEQKLILEEAGAGDFVPDASKDVHFMKQQHSEPAEKLFMDIEDREKDLRLLTGMSPRKRSN